MSDADPSLRHPRQGERLTPLDRSSELLPWRRADELTRCFLYWLPVSSFPATVAERVWLLQFFDRLSGLLTGGMGLREEIFFQFKELYELRNPFVAHQQEFMPICGLSRRPGAPLPTPPSFEEIAAMGKGILATWQAPDVKKFMPDYCYWFARKSAKKQRDLFLGHAALTITFLKPSSTGGAPQLPPQISSFLKNRPELKQLDVEGALASAGALRDGFLAKSKELFGTGLEDEPVYKGLLFILPLLTTADFFAQPAEEADKWFQLFDVYINESPADKGILLASKMDFEDRLIGLLNDMREEGLEYPGEVRNDRRA